MLEKQNKQKLDKVKVEHTAEDDNGQRGEYRIVQQDERILVKIRRVEAAQSELALTLQSTWPRDTPIPKAEPKHRERPNHILHAHLAFTLIEIPK